MALERRFRRPDGAKLALERRFGRPDDAKLALERRFGRPGDAKLALERRFGRPDDAKIALERRFGRPDVDLALERSVQSPRAPNALTEILYTRVLPSIYIDEGVFRHCKLVAFAKVLDSS